MNISMQVEWGGSELWQRVATLVRQWSQVSPERAMPPVAEASAVVEMEWVSEERVQARISGGPGVGKPAPAWTRCADKHHVDTAVAAELARVQSLLPSAVQTLAQGLAQEGAYLGRIRQQSLVDLVQPRGFATSAACEPCAGRGRLGCPGCGGARRVSCDSCRGSRSKTCPSCSGVRQRCLTCNGRGTTHTAAMDHHNLERHMYPCAPCNGSGFMRCHGCNDRGTTPCHCSDGTQSCTRCAGQGQLRCEPCESTGVRNYAQRVTLACDWSVQATGWRLRSGQVPDNQALAALLLDRIPPESLGAWFQPAQRIDRSSETTVRAAYRPCFAVQQLQLQLAEGLHTVHAYGDGLREVDANGLLERLLEPDRQAFAHCAERAEWYDWPRRDGGAVRRWLQHPVAALAGETPDAQDPLIRWNLLRGHWLAQMKPLYAQALTAVRRGAGLRAWGLFSLLALLAPWPALVLAWPVLDLSGALGAGVACAVLGAWVVPWRERRVLQHQWGPEALAQLARLAKDGSAAGSGQAEGASDALQTSMARRAVLATGWTALSAISAGVGMSLPWVSRARQAQITENSHYYTLGTWGHGPADYHQRAIVPRDWVDPLIAAGDERARLITAWGHLLNAWGVREDADPVYAKQLLDGANATTRTSTEWKVAMGVAALRHRLGNAPQGLQWLKEAAAAGHVHAMYELGELYLDRQRGHFNEAQGLRWLQRALEHKHASAGLRLAFAHLYGEGRLRADPQQAQHIYIRINAYGLARNAEFLRELTRRRR